MSGSPESLAGCEYVFNVTGGLRVCQSVDSPITEWAQSRLSVDRQCVQFREGEAPAEPRVSAVQRLARSLTLLMLTIIRDYTQPNGDGAP